MAVVRGCGTRSKGGCYLECSLSSHGSPIEEFLVDPPKLVDAEALGIKPLGVKLFEKNGITHIFDWVGSKHYPNVADFIEEVRRFGLSRRMNQNIDFSKLTEKSRIYLLHSRAMIDNSDEYKTKTNCPCHIKPHNKDKSQMCARLWWEDLDGGESLNGPEPRAVYRSMPSFQYFGLSTPEDIVPERRLAIFAWFPIQRFVVINDPDAGEHKKVMEKAKKGNLPVDLVEE